MSFLPLLNEEQRMLHEAVAGFATDVVAPSVAACEHSMGFSQAVVAEMSALGLFAVTLPEDRGGAGAGFVVHAAAVHALAQVQGACAGILAAQVIGLEALQHCAAENKLFDAAAQGTALIAPALRHGGQQVQMSRTSSAAMVTGVFHCVPFAGVAAAYVVEARDAQGAALVLIRAGTPGVQHARASEPLGMHGLALGALHLHDASGTVIATGAALEAIVSGGRIAVAALLGGVAQGALGHARRYADEREQFGHAIINFGGVQERIARASVRAAALEALTACAAAARGEQTGAHAALQARTLAATEAVLAADDCLQVFGGFGLSREYPAERHLRDARFIGFGEYDAARAHSALIGA